jgi:hypothetical protein
MPARPFILAIVVYVGLDLTNPFMPGAFIFDPEQSVEGVHAEGGRQHLASPAGPRVEAATVRPVPPRHFAPLTRRWRAEPRPAHVPAFDPPPLSEDH